MSDLSKARKGLDTRGVAYECYEDRGDYTVISYKRFNGRFDVLGEWDYTNDLDLEDFIWFICSDFGKGEV